jgi:hypothetical protein
LGSNLVLNTSTLLAQAVDANGDTVCITNVASASINGSPVLYNPGLNTITYVPRTNGLDRFYFGISDGYGGTNLVAVDVKVDSPDALSCTLVCASCAENGGGTWTDRITFAGVANLAFTIEVTDTLKPAHWQKLTNLTADAGGLLRLTSNTASSTRFYRTAYPARP